MKIFIICSKKFYSKCEYYKKELEKMGHEVILPNSYDDPEFEIRVRDASRKEHQILVKKLFLESVFSTFVLGFKKIIIILNRLNRIKYANY